METVPLFRLRNTSPAPEHLSWGEVIAGASVSEGGYSITFLAKHWAEITSLCLVVTELDPPFEDATAAVFMIFRDVGLLQERLIPCLPKRARPARRPTLERPTACRELIGGRLFAVENGALSARDFEQVTLAVKLKDSRFPEGDRSYGILDWPLAENIDTGVFEGIVRLIASTMSGKRQRVLLVGHLDSVETVAACVVREYLGCAAETALQIVRATRRTAISKSELLETVFRYRVS